MNDNSKLALASQLGDLLARLPLNQPDQWLEIQRTTQKLADDLRVKDVQQQTALGKTLLPQTLTSLIKSAIGSDGAGVTDASHKSAMFEILRVGANLCMDHDENRGHLLEAGFPQTVVTLLEGYADRVPSDFAGPMALSMQDLKVVKTSIGFLLNVSIGYEAVKFRLISLEAAMTILKLSMAIYPPGSWLSSHVFLGPDLQTEEDILESWNLRSGLSNWAWRAISELRDDGEENAQSRSLFGPDALPFLARPLQAFVPPYPSAPPLFAASPARRSLVQADYDLLEEVCGVLESLCLDVEDVRLSLARGLTFPAEHGGVPCLATMLTFVDKADYPPYWSSEPSAERAAMEKKFAICKAAIVKAVVETAGEDKNADILWDDSDPAKPGGEFINTMVQWIRAHKDPKETNRDDLIICATLSLGNLARRDAHSTALIQPPISLAPDLATILEPDTDIKVKHGVVGLLKHLAQSAGNRTALGKAQIIQKLASSQVWGEKADIAELVQVSAIGTAKHMCNGDAENALALIAPPSGSPALSGMDQILALVRRSDSIAVKSEGTRVLVNVIKALWSNDVVSKDGKAKRQKAMAVVATPATASALARLIGRSKRYPILINEGVVALSLLSMHINGGTMVLDAILNPLPSEVIRSTLSLSQPASAISSDGSPVADLHSALDMLVVVLKNTDNNFAVEISANVCALLGQLGRKGVVSPDRVDDVARMKLCTKELLETAAANRDGGARMLSAAAKRALEAFA
ncbi:uncharacterized protein LAESUDRAFT_734264 [Laetiporus sulphureus 93-53]|uniref:ARM repeat-containing protein n=1 Tax=Laetiporus sulphureus 93-53 TaxID=1314785 RepID=A0A165H8Q1_9APHY|nr:uncharacterized protein LAESUDRAFT_734264 [Laetiporus sulphureus 93-53]KZT11398.1 hypothetical protein LAESUDRAFT_734264 [Laetiporus sulphureus 93-53]